MKLVQADSPEFIAQVRELFTEYAASLGFSVCFQSFDQELAELPGMYAPPDGRLLLACEDAHAAGCVALRKVAEGVCEMKRLYLRPVFRGKGIGKALALAIIEETRKIRLHAHAVGHTPVDTRSDFTLRVLGLPARQALPMQPHRRRDLYGAAFEVRTDPGGAHCNPNWTQVKMAAQ